MAFNKVSAGQPFQPQAVVWNGFIDAANWVQQQQVNSSSQNARFLNQTGIVLVKNVSGSDADQFSVVALKNIGIEPTNEKSERTFKNDIPFFEFSSYDDNTKDCAIAVLQEPVKNNLTGKALVLGITPALVNIDNENHNSAVPDRENKFKLKSASDGDIKILWKPAQTGEKLCMLAVGLGGALAYKGIFKLTQKDNSIEITNGADEEAGNAGFLYINGEFKTCSKGSVSASSGYVCVKCSVSGSDYTTEYAIVSENGLAGDESTGYYVLGYVKSATGGGGYEVFQYYHATPHCLIVGSCKTDEEQA